ncbi:helix-turn-helix domain-containing protein [Mycobacteroides chelonae]|nr:hypothetical protein [Mycobacteroides chelonae]
MAVSGQISAADFKSIRESLGLTAQWLADAVHADQRTVRRWEDGDIPLRDDVVDILLRLDEQVEHEISCERARERARVLADLGHDLATLHDADIDEQHVFDHLEPQDWLTVEVPRVDADAPTITHANALLARMVAGFNTPLPAAFYRAAASRLRRALEGRLKIVYSSTG